MVHYMDEGSEQSEVSLNVVVFATGKVPAGILDECRYGANCYRRNPIHFEEFQHSDTSGVTHTRMSLWLDAEFEDVEEMICDRYLMEVDTTYEVYRVDCEHISPITTTEHLRGALISSCADQEQLVLVVRFGHEEAPLAMEDLAGLVTHMSIG